MKKEEIEQLEALFHKLEGHLKHPIILSTGCQDSICVGLYGWKDGQLLESQESESLTKTLSKFKLL